MNLKHEFLVQNWAMGGKVYIKKDVFELWVSGLTPETIFLPIPGQQVPERLNLQNPFTKRLGGLRLIYLDRVLRIQGLSSVQLKMLATTFLKELGYSQEDIDSSNVRFNRPFRIYPIARKSKSLLTGHRADDQYKLNLKYGPVARIRRITSRIYVLEIHALLAFKNYYFYDGINSKICFQVQRAAHYDVKGGSMHVVNKLLAIPFLGMNNVKRFLEHFSTANNLKYPNLKRPKEGQSNIYQL